MASLGGVEESLDFDFFESPRHQNEDPISPASKPPIHSVQLGTEVRPSTSGKRSNTDEQNAYVKPSTTPKKRTSSPNDSDGYSSDFASENEDRQAKNRNKPGPKKNKSKSKRSPSNSSLSSTGSNSSSKQSQTRRSRSDSKSGSDRDSSADSKSNSSVLSVSDEERPRNPIAKNSGGTMPKRGRSRLGEEEYSSSAYSEGEDNYNTKSPSQSHREDTKRKGSVKRNGTAQKQAWGDKPASKSKTSSRGSHQGSEKDSKMARPKTAHARGSRYGHAASAGSSSSRRRRSSPARSDTESLSDSDITDVSPMDSPRLQPGASESNTTSKTKTEKRRDDRLSAAGDGIRDKKHRFMALPVNGLDLSEDGGDESELPDHSQGDRGASNLDLEILMKAVGELEKQKRVQANTRRVMFAPMGASREKNNYTFDQSKTRDIERENQRLLNEIVRRVNSTTDQKKQFYASPAASYKLTPSAINRERDMKRIESENMAFLKRLQKVKPTTTICRDHQLRAYESTTLHGVPIAALHPLPSKGGRSGGSSMAGGGRRRSGASSMADTASSIGSRTRSMTSIHSGISSVRSSKRGSRPSSATVRPPSATKRVDTRPEWSDRW